MKYASCSEGRRPRIAARLTTPVCLAIFALIILCGCATVAPYPPLPESGDVSYQIEVVGHGPAEASADGFDAQFFFRVYALEELRQDCLVQELHQRTVYEYADGTSKAREFTLVEVFRLRRVSPHGVHPVVYELTPGQRDRHYMTGLTELSPKIVEVRVERRVFAYVARVRDADFTARGFAQVPRNERGDVATNVGKSFNAAYQEMHQTRGEVFATNRQGGIVYRLQFNLRRDGEESAVFTVDRGAGFGRVVPPQVLVAAR